jgi:hypothetical protein
MPISAPPQVVLEGWPPGHQATPAASSARRQAALGRGVAHHQQGAPLPVVGRRSRRQRTRHPGAAAAGQEGCQAGNTAGHGASAAPLFEQPCRELASAHAPAGTAPAAIQIPRARPTLPLSLRSHRFAFPTATPLASCPRVPSRNDPKISALAGDDGHSHSRLGAERGAGPGRGTRRRGAVHPEWSVGERGDPADSRALHEGRPAQGAVGPQRRHPRDGPAGPPGGARPAGRAAEGTGGGAAPGARRSGPAAV